MNDKKNVKLLVLLLVLVLAGALAFGMIPEEDSQGKLRGVSRPIQSGYTPTDDFRIGGGYTPTDDIMNRGGVRENLSILPHINAGYVPTDDFMPPPGR